MKRLLPFLASVAAIGVTTSAWTSMCGISSAQTYQPAHQSTIMPGAIAGPAPHHGGALEDVDVFGVMQNLDAQQSGPAMAMGHEGYDWWHNEVQQPQRVAGQQLPVSLHDLLYLALQNSAQIKVYSEVPLIRETAVAEAVAAFDWVKYAEGLWEDTSEPVGSSLTVGGAGDRFNDHNLNVTGGVKRRTWSGGEVDISQRFGHQNNNSNFFIPNDQGTSRLTLGFTQPLLRGRGRIYNQSLAVLASVDVQTANQEFSRQLQSHLLEIARGYWALYLERATLAQRVKLYLKTESIVGELEARQGVDAGKTQIISAKAALENRRADLIRAQTAVKNGETRLRALINAPQLGTAADTELIPGEFPTAATYTTDLHSEIAVAMQKRPEILGAMKEIKAGAVRLNVAKHELLPVLNLVTRSYLSGLQGDSDVGQAWLDQFSEGAPSYSIGLQYELPVGNRAARARVARRAIEIRQLQEQYRSALETVNAEVEIAVRELETAYRELGAKQRSLAAASAEAETIEARWQRVAGGQGSASLNLESLLRAQERVTETETELLTSQLTYNLALVNLRRANGTLLEVENVNIGKVTQCGVPQGVFSKGPSQAGNANHVPPVNVPCSSCAQSTPASMIDPIVRPVPPQPAQRPVAHQVQHQTQQQTRHQMIQPQPVQQHVAGENYAVRPASAQMPVERDPMQRDALRPQPGQFFPGGYPVSEIQTTIE